MGNGLLAEWRRSIVARGLAAALLLAMPIAVASAVGFSASPSGLTDGLDSLASGPESVPPAPDGTDSLDTALEAVAANTGAASQGATGGGSTGGAGGGVGGPSTGGGTETNTGTGTSALVTSGGGTGGAGDILAPIVGGGGSSGSGSSTGGGGAVGDLLNGVNQTVNGLLGGGQ